MRNVAAISSTHPAAQSAQDGAQSAQGQPLGGAEPQTTTRTRQLEVRIMGQSYLLVCPEEGEQRLRQAVERVDTAMCKIRDAGKVKARDRIAVLASLNLAVDLIEAETRNATLEPSAKTLSQAPPAAAAAASADSERMQQLMERLDQVLAGDGHLL